MQQSKSYRLVHEKHHGHVAFGVAGGLAITGTVHATNRMSLEGYGAKSGAMGSTGLAFDMGHSRITP